MDAAAQAWEALEPPWRDALELAWEAFQAGTIPVGAVVVDIDGDVIARGRNRIFDAAAPPGQLAGTRIAHAEINALAQLPPSAYESHVLYTTLEPCLVCFGAAVFSTIGTIRFAAADAAGVIARELELRTGSAAGSPSTARWTIHSRRSRAC